LDGLDSGVYALLLELRRSATVRAGSLGELRLPAGRYVYVGSARRGLAARLTRHCRREKRLRWHIDYLRPAAEVVGAVVWPWRQGRECRLARALLSEGLGQIAASRFGASDCRCPAHLLVVPSAELGILARELSAALGEQPTQLLTFGAEA
jgi:Uri superfamily endonuclease